MVGSILDGDDVIEQIEEVREDVAGVFEYEQPDDTTFNIRL